MFSTQDGTVAKTPTKRDTSIAQAGDYAKLLAEIKQRIRAAQVRTVLAANESLLQLYWEIGGVLAERQKEEGWGAGVLPKLAADIRNDLSDVKGFSVRNMRRMIQFRHEYPELFSIRPPAVAELDPPTTEHPIRQPLVAELLQQAISNVSWAHNITLLQKVKDLPARIWYAQQAVEQGWSRNVLALQIDGRLHERQGNAISNFSTTLPPAQSDLASQLLKDPYIFDFLTLEPSFRERELESGLLRHLQSFLMELGAGFAFVGRQVRVEVGAEDFYIDLLFYHLKLRCFVVVDLKVGEFKPEHVGKMNFYINAIDVAMRHEDDAPCIGLILCQEKNRVVAEYSLRGIDKAIGISAYELTRALPKNLQSALPTIEELELELSRTR